mmetsp:Transcript_15983/g.28797  ORF Transcript_15983/g.28797 Transcript_15983/m.28797 type:complete len:279 (+) Transcript_15983:197-1033(+)
MLFNNRTSLELVGCSETAIVWSPWVVSDEGNCDKLFIARKPAILVLMFHTLHHGVIQLFGIFHGLVFSRNTIFFRPTHYNIFVQLHDRNRAVHPPIAIAANSSINSINKLGVPIGHLHVLNCDILTTCQFNQVLLAINNLDATIRGKLPNVTGMKPPVSIKDFLGLFGHHVVTKPNTITFYTDFSTAKNGFPVHILTVGREIRQASFIIDFSARNYFHLNAWNRNSSNANTRVSQILKSQTSTCFSEPITLTQGDTKASTNKVLYIGVERSTTGYSNS